MGGALDVSAGDDSLCCLCHAGAPQVLLQHPGSGVGGAKGASFDAAGCLCLCARCAAGFDLARGCPACGQVVVAAIELLGSV